jgi:16S rRNA processing protein RimM
MPATGEPIAIARITRTRGLRGEVVAHLLTHRPERFDDLDAVTAERAGGRPLMLRLENHWFHQSRLVLKFVGYDTIEQAEQLVGYTLTVPEDEVVELDEDEYFHFQLIGCEVVAMNGAPVGVVAKILETAGTDLLVVRNGPGQERLIPLAASICVDVNTQSKRIQIDPPAGLLDL